MVANDVDYQTLKTVPQACCVHLGAHHSAKRSADPISFSSVSYPLVARRDRFILYHFFLFLGMEREESFRLYLRLWCEFSFQCTIKIHIFFIRPFVSFCWHRCQSLPQILPGHNGNTLLQLSTHTTSLWCALCAFSASSILIPVFQQMQWRKGSHEVN